MNQQDDNQESKSEESTPLEGYGQFPSVQEAIENLAVACMAALIPVPKRIVWGRGGLIKYQADMLLKIQSDPTAKTRISTDRSVNITQRVIKQELNSGMIELVEEN